MSACLLGIHCRTVEVVTAFAAASLEKAWLVWLAASSKVPVASGAKACRLGSYAEATLPNLSRICSDGTSDEMSASVATSWPCEALREYVSTTTEGSFFDTDTAWNSREALSAARDALSETASLKWTCTCRAVPCCITGAIRRISGATPSTSTRRLDAEGVVAVETMLFEPVPCDTYAG